MQKGNYCLFTKRENNPSNSAKKAFEGFSVVDWRGAGNLHHRPSQFKPNDAEQFKMQDTTDRLFAYFSKQNHSKKSRDVSFEDFIQATINGDFSSGPLFIRHNNVPKQESLYKEKKANQPHVFFGAVPGMDKTLNNLQELTGYVYLDIDDFSTVDSGAMRDELFSLPFIVGVWLSFGGRGFGALAYCPELLRYRNDHDAYRECYNALSVYLERNSGIRLEMDEKCKNPNRQTAISYDPLALFRKDFEGFDFRYVPKEKSLTGDKDKEGDMYAGINYDPELRFDIELARQFQFLNEDYYYAAFVVIDSATQRPVEWDESILNIRNGYELARYVSKETIRQCEIHNADCTMAYLPNGYHRMVIKVGKENYIKCGRRARTMKAITLTYLGIKLLTDGVLYSKPDVYHILYQLNKKCVRVIPIVSEISPSLLNLTSDLNIDGQVSVDSYSGNKNKSIEYMPLEDEELNKLATVIFNTYNSDDFNLNSVQGKEWITDDFYKSQANKLGIKILGTSEKRSIRIGERNRLMGHFKTNKWIKILSELHSNNPGITYTKAIDYIIEASKMGPDEGKPISRRTAEKRIRRFREKWRIESIEDAIFHEENSSTALPSTPTYIPMEGRSIYPFSGGKTIDEYLKTSPPFTAEGEKVVRQKIKKTIEELFESGIRIRQKDVAARLGMKPNRLSNHWEPFRMLVKEKNEILSSVCMKRKSEPNSHKLIADAIERFFKTKKINQKEISVETGLSLRTVASHWPRFKSQVARHNAKINVQTGVEEAITVSRTNKIRIPILFLADNAA